MPTSPNAESLPAVGEHVDPVVTPTRLSDTELERMWTVVRVRAWIGYGFKILSASAVFIVAANSLKFIHGYVPPVGLEAAAIERFAYVKLGLCASITCAIVLFCGQLIRMAERMVLPYWWTDRQLAMHESAKPKMNVLVRALSGIGRVFQGSKTEGGKEK